MRLYIYTSIIFAWALVSCGRFGNSDKKEENKIRLVSASKQYTEFIYALGADSNLVAVDISSTYPEQVKKLPTIGYHMKLSFEGIMSAKPTLFLHKGGNFGIGPEPVVQQLKKLNVPMKTFENKATDIPSTKSLLKEMGVYFKQQEQAKTLCAKLDADMKLALNKRAEFAEKPKVIVIHFGQAMNIYMAVGKNSVAGKMVEWAGGNIPLEKKGMSRITSPELIAKINPDVILITDFGYDRLGSTEKINQLPGVGLTNAAKNNRIYRVEEHDMIYLGPRTGENVLKLQALIHQKP